MIDPGTPIQILLVEDSPYDAMLLRERMADSALPHTLTHVSRGEDAIAALVAGAGADLIIADYHLPGMTGLEMCRRVLDMIPDTAMILLTGSGSEDIAVQALKAGVNDYLVKDVSGNYLDLMPLKVSEVVQVAQDRVARRKAEAALRQSEARYRGIVEDQTELICRFDRKFNLTFVNAAFCRYFRRSNARTIGMSLLPMISDEDRPVFKGKLQTINPFNPVIDVEFRVVLPDGEMRWQEWTIRSIFDDDAVFDEFQAVGRDITERIQSEDDLRQRNEELDAFAHTVAHDLKNPLSVIAGFADALRAGYGTKQNTGDIVEAISHSSNKAINIVNELLLLSSVRKEDVDLIPLDMEAITQNVVERLANVIDEKDATLLLPEEWPSMMGYAAWVEEVLVNYVSNALKYGGTPPVVELGARQEPAGAVRVFVKDNGAGISPERQDRLFTPFVRLNRAALSVGGHGLGLSIVQRIVAKLGGTVGVDSRPGEGSCFYFTLPAAADWRTTAIQYEPAGVTPPAFAASS